MKKEAEVKNNESSKNEVQLKNEIQKIQKQVTGIVINSEETFNLVSQSIILAKTARKRVVDYFKTMKDPAHAAWKAICNNETQMLNPVNTFIKTRSKDVSNYLTQKEKERQAEQARLDKERQAKEDAEKAKLNKKADKAEEKGNIEKAEALREEADQVYVPTVVSMPEVAKTTHVDTGTISQVKALEVTITNKLALIKALCDRNAPLEIIEIKEGKLKDYIKSLGVEEFPGCAIDNRIKGAFRATA